MIPPTSLAVSIYQTLVDVLVCRRFDRVQLPRVTWECSATVVIQANKTHCYLLTKTAWLSSARIGQQCLLTFLCSESACDVVVTYYVVVRCNKADYILDDCLT